METKLKVLIADDSDEIVRRLRNMVLDLDFVSGIGHARNGDEARVVTNFMQPSVVILDIRMPGQSGIEVLREIKQNYPQTAVIILTNHAEEEWRTHCREAGADYFLDKSKEFDQIPAILEAIAGKPVS
jgi:DNA-binding NarL/FixJ family response regulator